jgi:hypothetical protein
MMSLKWLSSRLLYVTLVLGVIFALQRQVSLINLEAVASRSSALFEDISTRPMDTVASAVLPSLQKEQGGSGAQQSITALEGQKHLEVTPVAATAIQVLANVEKSAPIEWQSSAPKLHDTRVSVAVVPADVTIPQAALTAGTASSEIVLNCFSEGTVSPANNKSQTTQYCCADSWEQENVDDWWLHNPDWEVSRQNDTTFCFSPIRQAERAHFLKNQLYPQQHLTNCSNVKAHILINSGFSAHVALNGKAFMSASRHNQTYVMVKHDRKWRYGRYLNKSHVCDSVDMDCYFLPLSNCHAPDKQKDDIPSGQTFNVNGGHNTWIRDYMLRPKQWVRKRIYDMLKEVPHPIPTPCTVMHVRRTDAILEENWKKRRHYFPLSDYVERVPDDHKAIVLLTDDQTAIDEAHEFHSDRKWIYVNRTRHRGTEGGMNGHIPSGDPVYELSVILAEMQLAGHCQHLVFTRSGFKDLILQALQVKHPPASIQISKIDLGRQPNATHAQTADEFFAGINAKRDNATLKL